MSVTPPAHQHPVSASLIGKPDDDGDVNHLQNSAGDMSAKDNDHQRQRPHSNNNVTGGVGAGGGDYGDDNDGGDHNLTQTILDEINRLGNGSAYLWKLFFICMTPSILNGLHVSSYVFLGEPPANLTCIIPALQTAQWTHDEIHQISTLSITDRCNIRNWDYDLLANMTFDDAWTYVHTPTTLLPAEVSCMSQAYTFEYDNVGTSIVPEWNLVCENDLERTAVQVALSFGKFVGAFLFGIISDKYGRKTSITVSSVIYIVCGPLAAVARSYWLFVLARVGLGVAGSGVYHSAYTILTEFASIKYRSTLSIFFSVSYPLGMTLLALIAYLVRPWRMLQFALSAPALLLIVHYFFQKESPRWLINKGRLPEAYRIVFGKQLAKENVPIQAELAKQRQSITELQTSGCEHFVHNVSDGLSELRGLYGDAKLRGRLIICHVTFFVASLTYYVTALNGNNFLANEYAYVAVTGLTEVPSYIVPCLMFRWMGRKSVTLLLYLVAGVALLSVLLIPIELTDLIITVAMFGRFCISAGFAVAILHTAELFPTHLRSSAIGLSSTMAHVGAISSPYIVDILGRIEWYIPTTICGGTAIVAGLLALLLPETVESSLEEVDEVVDKRRAADEH